MIAITATDAARNFASTLDRAEHGETIVITRGGRPVARLTPAAPANGAAFKRLLTEPVDSDFAKDVTEARATLHTQEREWQD